MRGFTLIELLVVIVILSLLMALILPALVESLKVAREATASELVTQLYTACRMYETDWSVYPPGDGCGSRGLAAALGRSGCRRMPYFETNLPGVLTDGHFTNPVWRDAPPPINIVYYRNNQMSEAFREGFRQPPVYHRASVDIWCAGADWDPADPSTGWGVRNW